MKSWDYNVNRGNVDGEGFGGGYDLQIFASDCFGTTKEARDSVLFVKGREEDASIVWFAKLFNFIWLRCG